jgi:hypothetical protein
MINKGEHSSEEVTLSSKLQELAIDKPYGIKYALQPLVLYLCQLYILQHHLLTASRSVGFTLAHTVRRQPTGFCHHRRRWLQGKVRTEHSQDGRPRSDLCLAIRWTWVQENK